MTKTRVAVVAGARTPFVKADKELHEMGPLGLARGIVQGLLERRHVDPGDLDAPVFGARTGGGRLPGQRPARGHVTRALAGTANPRESHHGTSPGGRKMQEPLKVLVVGATGGSGRATVRELCQCGHNVTAFSRSASKLRSTWSELRTIDGDVMSLDDIDLAMQGQDAVVVTLGITENPMRVRLLGSSGTPLNVRSAGTRNVIAAMRRHGVRRLIVQSSYGVGETRHRLRAIDSLMFSLLLKPQIDDTEEQERAVRASDVDWTLVRPVHLTDVTDEEMPFASTSGEVREWSVSRVGVGRFLSRAVSESELVHCSVALSGK